MSTELQKEGIRLSHLIVLFTTIVIPVFIWGISVEKKIAILEFEVAASAKLIQSNDSKQNNNYNLVLVELKELNKNIFDLKVELQNKKNR